MVWLLRHRPTKGTATARPHLNHRVTPRLHTYEVALHFSGIGMGMHRISGDGRGGSCKRAAVETSILKVRKSYSSESHSSFFHPLEHQIEGLSSPPNLITMLIKNGAGNLKGTRLRGAKLIDCWCSPRLARRNGFYAHRCLQVKMKRGEDRREQRALPRQSYPA